jgi:AraC-like DNA-binding protein
MDSFPRAPGVGKGSVETLLRYSLQKKMDLSQCLKGSGIKDDFLVNPVDVSVPQELIVIENVLKFTGKPLATGFAVGLGFQMMDLGVVGLALMSSKDGAHATKIVGRYVKKAYHFNNFSIALKRRKVTITLQAHDDLTDSVAQFVVARDLGIFHMIQTYILHGQARNTFEVGFSFNFLQGMEGIASAFSCPVRHNQTSNYLVYDIRQLRLRPSLSNAINACAIENFYQMELSELSRIDGFVSKIKRYLISQPSLNIKKRQVAEHLNMTERTLARHLEKKGLSWRKLLSEVRLKKAEQLLNSSDYSIQKITDEVGFSSVSSLSHAFSKDKGMSPSEYRKSMNRLTVKNMASA